MKYYIIKDLISETYWSNNDTFAAHISEAYLCNSPIEAEDIIKYTNSPEFINRYLEIKTIYFRY